MNKKKKKKKKKRKKKKKKKTLFSRKMMYTFIKAGVLFSKQMGEMYSLETGALFLNSEQKYFKVSIKHGFA